MKLTINVMLNTCLALLPFELLKVTNLCHISVSGKLSFYDDITGQYAYVMNIITRGNKLFGQTEVRLLMWSLFDPIPKQRMETKAKP